jgi:adenylosuccinate synthase
VHSTELTQLQASCSQAHKAYRAARISLAAAVNKSPDSESIAELVTSTQELGLNATLHRLKTTNPKVADAITALVEASDSLSHAIGDRESFLTQQNPAHQRVYIEDGREFTLDVEKGVWTYLDDPDHPIKVTLTKEHKLPYDLLAFKGPNIEPPKPTRKRKLQPRM